MNPTQKAPIAKSTIFFYAASAIILVIGIVSLASQVNYFNTVVAQYVAQGYEKAEVLSQLMPSQLLPSVFSTLSANLGLSAVLFGLGLLSQKLSALMPQEEVTSEEVSEAAEMIDGADLALENTEEIVVENVEVIDSENVEITDENGVTLNRFK